MKHRLLAAALGLSLASLLPACNVGPNYERPSVTSAASYRGPVAPATDPAVSVADRRWWELFEDETLKTLIQTAIEKNYDVRIAVARRLEAEAQLGVTDAEQLPTASAALSGQGSQFVAGTRLPSSQQWSATLGVSWEIDFWGKLRRASEAARADVLASEWGRRAAVQSLVAQVASSYFILRGLDELLTIAENTLAARRESLRLTVRREQSGAGSLLDIRQAEELVQLADGERITLERQIAQQENLITTLLGVDPGPIARGRPLSEQKLPPAVPAGLPSQLLERRPDVQVAEQQLVSANAQIGVAEAQRLPALSLTGSGGIVSGTLLALFTSPAALLSAAGNLVQPLFDGGRLAGQVSAADARAQQAALVYGRTVVQALREVSDALIGFQRNRELMASRDALLEAARRAQALAELRYQGGSSNFLEVLDASTRQLDAELALVRAHLDTLLSYVDIYRALGGGWQV